MTSAWRLNSEDRQALIMRLQERRLEDRDHDLLADMLQNGVSSMEWLLDREKRRGKSRDKRGSSGGKKETRERANRGRGHGRISADDYTGATLEPVIHETLCVGDQCPDCQHGRIFEMKQPAKQVTLLASSPIQATCHLKQRLRCSGCQKVFVAADPEIAGFGKTHPTANAAVAIWKFGLGVPFKRLEQWQKAMGVPLPDATQFEMVELVANCCFRIFERMERQAADASCFHSDDTNFPILSMIDENKTLAEKDRHGMRATGIIARNGDRDIHLFYLGRQHSGGSLDRLLDKRSEGLPAPLQMGDASSCNTTHGHDTVMCFCSSHAVRKFKTTGNPEYADQILSLLKAIFVNDAEARRASLTDEERLTYHQTHSSGPIKELERLFLRLDEERLVEPNSSLGRATRYMTKRWAGFTRFLEVPGAPLDNNIVERALKQIIRVRKNSGFFKTDHGAHIGSILFSILATAVAAGADPMHYLTAVQMHRKDVQKSPDRWFPWNYRDRLAELDTG